MLVRIDELKVGMRVKTKRGWRQITGLKWRRTFPDGRVQYFWLAEKIHPQNAEGIVGAAHVLVEVENG